MTSKNDPDVLWALLAVAFAFVLAGLMLAGCVTTRTEEEKAVCMVECVRGKERPSEAKVQWCKWVCGY